MRRIDVLLRRKKELQEELWHINREIEQIQEACRPHPNRVVTNEWRDPVEGRTYRDYYCPDCEKRW
jgi:hypothetical protein